MKPEEEAKMLNEDHEIWKHAREMLHRSSEGSILDVPGFDLDGQLGNIIMTFRALNRKSQYHYTAFSQAAPLYLDGHCQTIPLCTTDAHLAELWVYQINQVLQKSREDAIEHLRTTSAHDAEFEQKLEGLFSARCVDMSIDPAIGERDDLIKGMHYIGIIVSYWKAERTGNYDAAKDCEAAYNSLKGEL